MALIRTPHAAVIVWNYDDRLSVGGATDIHKVNEMIISTVSLISITTNKSKGSPVGTFSIALAPTRNWVSVITPGSWCAILMSNESLDKNSFQKAKDNQVKMLGRIDTVRVDVSVNEEGARQTRYIVSGEDWGSIFNNVVYVDPIIQDPSDPTKSMGNAVYQQFSSNIFSGNGDPLAVSVPKNLQTILSIMGEPVKLPETDRLAKATHNISLPNAVSNFFQFRNGLNVTSTSAKFMELIKLVWGPLKEEDVYDNSTPEQTGIGWMDPFSMVGQHSLWSILQDNSNYALNEMYPEMYWPGLGIGPVLILYNRIKPFSYTKNPASPDKIDTSMRSMFQLVASHKLEDESIINVNAGTNWRDKYNFVEIKPALSELSVLGGLLKDKSQAYQGDPTNSDVFDREGFRPIMFSIKQLPFNTKGITDPIQTSKLEEWVNLVKEWYFDSHKLLNGRIVMHGSSEYIPVGDNIMFDAGLINITPNHNSGSVKKSNIFVLGHVESVQNNFSVGHDGTRSFQTTIQFVRGIFVDEDKNLIGEGTIDTLASALAKTASVNSRTVYEDAMHDKPKES